MTVQWLDVGADGRLDVAALAQRLDTDVALVAVDLVDHATGVVQPVGEMAAIASRYGVPLHCELAEAGAWMPVDLPALGVSTAALSAHELGGPRGIGALVCQHPAKLEPLWGGGSQEDGLRPGTPAVQLARGFAAVVEPVLAQVVTREYWATLRDELERRLLAMDGAFVVGAGAPRLANTLAVGFAHAPAAVVGADLGRAGVIVDVGVEPDGTGSILRISLGAEATLREITTGVEVIGSAVARWR